MPRSLAFGIAVVALVVVIVTVRTYFGAAGGPGGQAGGGPAMLAGAPAASYAIKTLDGARDSLDRYRGRVVFVNLWASWCAPCRSETPALERLFEENRARGLVVLGIDQGESATAASAFAKEMNLRYPILLDEEQQYGRAYAAIGLPTSLVVDRTGHIVRGIDGELTLAQMRDAVAPLLAAKAQ
jgi:thiol-disulfide isomerase/thioredoxin